LNFNGQVATQPSKAEVDLIEKHEKSLSSTYYFSTSVEAGQQHSVPPYWGAWLSWNQQAGV